MKNYEIAERLNTLRLDIIQQTPRADEEKRRLYRAQNALHVRHEIQPYSPVLGDPEFRRYIERQIARQFADHMVKGQHFAVGQPKDPYYGVGCYGNIRIESEMYCFTPDALKKLIDDAVESGRRCA